MFEKNEEVCMKSMVEMIPINRRDVIKFVGLGAVAGVSSVLLPKLVKADAKAVDEAIKKAVGGKQIATGKINLEVPQIAENGNTVPISFSVDSPMTDNDYVKTVHLFADKNPRPEVAVLHFSPASGKASASTRMRMAKTQNIVAVAEMSNGSVFMSKAEVKVTIGGCGG
jgi:sulfur-oxidizing protein SoxY